MALTGLTKELAQAKLVELNTILQQKIENAEGKQVILRALREDIERLEKRVEAYKRIIEEIT